MAKSTVSVVLGSGADDQATSGKFAVRRVVEGVDGNMLVLSAWKDYTLGTEPIDIEVETGVMYESREIEPRGAASRYWVGPATATNYGDLPDVLPVIPGPGIFGDAIVNDVVSNPESDAYATLEQFVIEHPGPQGEPGVADDVTMAAVAADPESEFSVQVSANIATLTQTLYPVAGESATATTTRINQALADVSPFGSRRTVALVGDFTHNGPLVVPSHTVFDTTKATLTLAANSLCNGIINTAVNTSLRMMNAAITSGSTALTGTGFAAGHVGKPVVVWYKNPSAPGTLAHRTTIASVTNGTTAVMTDAAPASSTGVNLYCSVGDRDKDITLKLGRLRRLASNWLAPANGWLSNHVRLRHVDGYEMDVANIEVVSGKYAVNIGDCTDGNVTSIYTPDSASDLLHLNGPVSGLKVGRVVSAGSGDDIVSLTGGDFTTIHQMADCQGDIEDVHVGTISTAPSTNPNAYTRGLLLLGGRNADSSIEYHVSDITLDYLDSALTASPILIGQDTQDSNTTGGTFADIRLCVAGGANRPKAGGTAPGGLVNVSRSVDRLTIGPVRNHGGAYDVVVGAGVTVTDANLVGVTRSRVRRFGTFAGGLKVLGDKLYGAARGKVTTIARDTVGVQAVSLVSGTIYFAYFRPEEGDTIASLFTKTRSPAAAGTTLARYGLYEVNKPADDDLTLIASSNSDTSMWNGTFGGVGRNLASSVVLDPAKVYAAAVLFVGTTAPSVMGIQGDGSELALPDRRAMCMTGQTDLPAAITWNQLQSSEGKLVYFRLS